MSNAKPNQTYINKNEGFPQYLYTVAVRMVIRQIHAWI